MSGPYAIAAVKLFKAGFVPLPLRPETKIPAFAKWQTYADTPPTRELLNDWVRKYPNGNVGILTGTKLDVSFALLVVDIDSDEPQRDQYPDDIRNAGGIQQAVIQEMLHMTCTKLYRTKLQQRPIGKISYSV